MYTLTLRGGIKFLKLSLNYYIASHGDNYFERIEFVIWDK